MLFGIAHGRYSDFREARFDLGNMVQAVWSTTQGRVLEISEGSSGEQMTRLGAHVDPLLTAIAPLWMLAPSPLTLVAVQIAAVSLGALPVFWLGRRHLGSERAAALLAFAYLAYPWIAWTAVDPFHPVTIGIPLLLFCIWFLDGDRLIPFGLCAVLAASTGELMGAFVAGLGVWYAFGRGRRLAGAAIAVAGVGWTLIALYVVVPAFSGEASVFYGFYEHVGRSPFGIVKTAVTDPGAILGAVVGSRDVLYVVLLAVPLGGLFVLSPGLSALALPQLAANLLADWPSTTDPHAHYVAGILPFLFAATAIGLARLTPEGRLRGAVLVLTLSTASTIVAGPWPGAIGGMPTWYRPKPPQSHIAALRHAVSLVPDGAPVASTNRVGSHLSAREFYYSVPVVRSAEWIVVDSTDTWIPAAAGGFDDPRRLEAFVQRIEGSPLWRPVFVENDVQVFRRVAP